MATQQGEVTRNGLPRLPLWHALGAVLFLPLVSEAYSASAAVAIGSAAGQDAPLPRAQLPGGCSPEAAAISAPFAASIAQWQYSDSLCASQWAVALDWTPAGTVPHHSSSRACLTSPESDAVLVFCLCSACCSQH